MAMSSSGSKHRWAALLASARCQLSPTDPTVCAKQTPCRFIVDYAKLCSQHQVWSCVS
jgi:hypothetical protein